MTDTYRDEHGSPHEAQSNATGRLFKAPTFAWKPVDGAVGTLPAAPGGPPSYNPPGFSGQPGQTAFTMPDQMSGPVSSPVSNPAPNSIPAQQPFRQTYTLEDVEQAQSLDFISTRQVEAVRARTSTTGTAPRSIYLQQVRKHPKLVLVSALCLLALLAALGYTALHILKGAPSVTLYRATLQTVSQNIGGGGIVYPAQRLDISYPFSSRVLTVFVKPGDKVTPNQPLVQLDLSSTNARNLAQLQVQVAEAKQEMAAAQQYLDSVIPTGKSVVIAQAQQQYSAAQARYNALLTEADSPALHQGNLISPIAGTVTAVNVYPGQMSVANKVMLTVFDESSVIVRVKVPLINYDQVRLNLPATITPSALPDESFNGTVVSIIPSVDSQTDTFEVWIKVKNANGNLLPGMSAFAQVQDTVQALVVPRLAVLNPDRDSIVFVERMEHVYIQHVQVVGYSGDAVLVGSGLSPNDLVVLVGLDSLQDGQQVHVAGIENQAN